MRLKHQDAGESPHPVDVSEARFAGICGGHASAVSRQRQYTAGCCGTGVGMLRLRAEDRFALLRAALSMTERWVSDADSVRNRHATLCFDSSGKFLPRHASSPP